MGDEKRKLMNKIAALEGQISETKNDTGLNYNRMITVFNEKNDRIKKRHGKEMKRKDEKSGQVKNYNRKLANKITYLEEQIEKKTRQKKKTDKGTKGGESANNIKGQSKEPKESKNIEDKEKRNEHGGGNTNNSIGSTD